MSRVSLPLIAIGAVLGLLAGQTPSQCSGQPSTNRFVELPKVDYPADHTTLRNYNAKDLAILDVLVSGSRMRVFYTTEGAVEPNTLQLYPGRLRMVDVHTAIPDLAVTAPAFTLPLDVPGWNSVLGGDLPAEYGKTGSIVGMQPISGNLFVHGPRRNRDEPVAGTFVPQHDPWNGLTYIHDATARPSNMQLTELWSAGEELGIDPYRDFEAVPEGSEIAYAGDDNRYYVAANYCGSDWAGHLLVLHLPNLASIDFNQRVVLPLYEFLGDWLDGLTPGKPVPTSALSVWPLGPEVPRVNFTCPSTPTGPDCSVGADTVAGNKLRPILYVDCDTATMEGRRLLIAGLNLDPIDIASYGGVLAPLDNGGRDDGKYDYVCIMDITDMKAAMTTPMPPGTWHYQDLAAWKAHTTFLRVPPDAPSGWDYTQGATALGSGHDWSHVRVLKPGDPSTFSDERIVGSGTLKSIALHPNGRYVYVVASDQGQEPVAENQDLTDGGWHVPHLYVLDLGHGDLTDQAVCNSYAPTIPGYRLNKLVNKVFPGVQELIGSTLVNSTTIPKMPTSNPSGTTGLTLIGGATCAQVGPYYPGEYQSDPTARTKLVAVRNLNFASSPDRLYVGTTLRAQSTDPAAKGVLAGAVHTFSLAGDGTPGYLHTLTIPQVAASGDYYQLNGMDAVPAAWLASPFSRNVIAITAANTRAANDNPVDRFVLVQDDLP